MLFLVSPNAHALRKPDFISNDSDIQKAIRQIDIDRADINNIFFSEAFAQKQIDKLERQRNLHFTRAARLAMDLYDIWPPPGSSKTSVMPWTAGKEIELVVVSQSLEPRSVVDASGNGIDIKPAVGEVGKAFADGIIIMYPRAFGFGVGFLGSTLYHETIHYRQYTTNGNEMNPDDRQVQAYEAQILANNYFGLTREQIAVIRERKDFHYSESRKMKLLGDGYFGDGVVIDAERGGGLTESKKKEIFELSSEAAQQNQWVAEYKESVEEFARKREARKEAEAKSKADMEEARRRWWDRLFSEAKKCGYRPAQKPPVNIKDSWWGSYEKFARLLTWKGQWGENAQFRMHGDIDVMKARFLARDACAHGRDAYVEPCNDSFDSVEKFWGDESFRFGLSTIKENDDYIRGCLIHLVNDSKSPRDWKDFLKKIDSWQGMVNAANKKGMANEEFNRRQKERDRQGQSFHSRPRPDYNDCLEGNCVDLPDHVSVPSLPQ